MRGLAALIVAGHHGISTFVAEPGGSWLYPVDQLFWVTNPNSAVFFFFVLSGYVLGRSFERDPAYIRFCIRRAFRILPAFIVSVFLAYVCIALLRYEPGPADLSNFFRSTHPVLTMNNIWENLIFKNTLVNGPSWSIYPEIFGSLSLPVLIYVTDRVPSKFRVLMTIAVAASLAISPSRIRIALWFYAGYCLPPLFARYLPNTWVARAAAFLLGYFLIRYMGPTSNVNKITTIGPSAIGASLMIAAVISSDDFVNGLRSGSARFLGRVSYSFYLFHWPVLYLTALAAISLAWFPHGYGGNILICSISIIAALGVSTLTYRWVELPFIATGRVITGNLKPMIPQALPMKADASNT